MKIYSDNNIFLVEPKNYGKSSDIIFGDVLRISITTNNSYYFATDIPVIHKSNIVSSKEGSESEYRFFELLSKKREIPFSKKLASEYNLTDYIEV